MTNTMTRFNELFEGEVTAEFFVACLEYKKKLDTYLKDATEEILEAYASLKEQGYISSFLNAGSEVFNFYAKKILQLADDMSPDVSEGHKRNVKLVTRYFVPLWVMFRKELFATFRLHSTKEQQCLFRKYIDFHKDNVFMELLKFSREDISQLLSIFENNDCNFSNIDVAISKLESQGTCSSLEQDKKDAVLLKEVRHLFN